MDTQGITEATELARIRAVNAEQVYFQDLKNEMIIRLNQQWKSCNEIQGSFQNKYYNFQYITIDCYNQSGDRNFILYITVNSYTTIDGWI